MFRSLLLLCILSFSFNVPLIAADKPIVFVSILPQKFFVEQIAADKVDVRVMVEPGQAPETYEPTPQKMAALAKAQRFFSIGLAFENKLLDTIASIKIVKPMQISSSQVDKNHRQHNMGEEHQDQDNHIHEHDPHIWLDPLNVREQADLIYTHLLQLLPADKAFLDKNYQRFNQKLLTLNQELSEKLVNSSDSHFLIFHPALGHFAKRYHLHQVSIEYEGKQPSARYVAELLQKLRRQSIQYILVEKQFSQKEADTIGTQLGAKLLAIDPLGYSYFENMREISAKVKQALY